MDNPYPSETTSRSGGAVGTALLVAVLFALVLGVYGAVYIDAFRSAPMQPVSPTAATAPSTAPSTPVATIPPTAPTPQTIPKTVAIPPAPALAQINPAASRGTPAPGETIKPPPYWVEYGAYRGTFYAEKLVEQLDAAGIKAEIKQVRGAAGRRYFSVRSTATTDHARADANAKLAAARIGIAPLIHRGDGAALAPPAIAKVAPTATAASKNGRYWVQFGAYNLHRYALVLRSRLQRAGVDVTILVQHRTGYARYLVRSPASLQRGEARSLAARGQSILGTVPLVGRALSASQPATERPFSRGL